MNVKMIVLVGLLLVEGVGQAVQLREGDVAHVLDREVYVHEPNFDESKIPDYTLEDPLTFADGRQVTWSSWPDRRREILEIFAHEMYGVEPPAPESVEVDLVDVKTNAVAGFAIRRQYKMWFKRDRTGPCLNWIVWLPRHARKAVPVVSFLNYNGNAELFLDRDIPLLTAYSRGPNGDGTGTTTAYFESIRGRLLDPDNRTHFPIQTIIARGYAVMSACYCEVSPDPDISEKDPRHRQDPFAYTGVFDLWGVRDPARKDNPTALGAWAWALSRGLDLAERIPEIDAKRAVVTGYSRLGKAALLAAARDERFKVCVPNQTGGGGVPLAKRDFGENVSTENRMFTHWYCKAYAKYAKEPHKTLTFDQHLLLACIAPRGLLVEGFDQPWFDTKGEYLAVKAASPAWELLTGAGLPQCGWPDVYETSAIGDRLGYVRRTEAHGLSAVDWNWLLDFADRNVGIDVFASPAKGSAGIVGKGLQKDISIADCNGDVAAAMRACGEGGGGRVVVPEGVWPAKGPVRFYSNCTLELSEGAVLEFSDDPKDYLPAVMSSWEGVECKTLSPLIYAYGCTNVAIVGSGTIAPKMDFWKTWFARPKSHMDATRRLYDWCSLQDVPPEARDVTALASSQVRPHLMQFNRCKNVRLDGFKIRESPFWTIHLFLSEDCHVSNLDVCAHGHNNDGVDVEMSRNVLIENCTFDQGDDAIVIKSGRNRDAWRLNHPSENIEIRNCRVKNGHVLLGIGSELSGGVRNVWMHDCTLESNCFNLFYVKTNERRGGFVKDIRMENVVAKNVRDAVLGVETDVLYQWKDFPTHEIAVTDIEGLTMRNVQVESAQWLMRIRGDSRKPVRNVVVDNVRCAKVMQSDVLEHVR